MDKMLESLHPFIPIVIAIIAYFGTDKIKRDKEKSKSKIYEWKEMYDQQKKIIDLKEQQVMDLVEENNNLRKIIVELEKRMKETIEKKKTGD